VNNPATEYAEMEVENIRQVLPLLNFDDQALLHFAIEKAYLSGRAEAIKEIVSGVGK
jgi:hypothetical protein